MELLLQARGKTSLLTNPEDISMQAQPTPLLKKLLTKTCQLLKISQKRLSAWSETAAVTVLLCLNEQLGEMFFLYFRLSARTQSVPEPLRYRKKKGRSGSPAENHPLRISG